ncbi:MAG: hypothetical protein RLZZ46_1109 [Bacteroidota bacterium]|jgi:hypothetical protein
MLTIRRGLCYTLLPGLRLPPVHVLQLSHAVFCSNPAVGQAGKIVEL